MGSKWDAVAKAVRENPEQFLARTDPTISDLKASLARKKKNHANVEKQIACHRDVIAFLEAKQAECDKPVTPGMFVEDVKRIYAEHGLKPPPNAPKGVE